MSSFNFISHQFFLFLTLHFKTFSSSLNCFTKELIATFPVFPYSVYLEVVIIAL